MLSVDVKKTKLGTLGERIVAMHYQSKGHEVQWVESEFDQTGDMYIDGELTEVKTQRPWIRQNAFTYQPNQEWKLNRAPRIVFINTDTGDLFETKGGSYRTSTKVTSDNRRMILVPINQPALRCIGRATEIQLREMRRLSTSEW